jgi:hypothetical protein
VEPSSATNIADVAVAIEGANFRLPLVSSLDDGRTIVEDLIVTIGDVQLVGVTRRDDRVIDGTVLSGLPIGSHDVVVQIGDATDVLEAGYTVVSSRVRPPEGPCGRPGAIADDFADATAAPQWFVDGASDVVEQTGTLAITPRAMADSGYRSQITVDLRDGATEIEVRSMVSGSGAGAFFRVSNGSDSLEIGVVDGALQLRLGSAVMLSVPFDPVAHRIWRIAETAGAISMETSPDGTVWDKLLSTTTPPWAQFATVSFGARNPNGVGDPGTVTFAEHSTFVAPAAWCPVAGLGDDFGDAQIGLAWGAHAHTSGACSEFETAGAARADQNGGEACDAFYAGSTLYTLEGSAMLVRITAITNFATGWITYFGGFDLEGRLVRMYFDNNEMCVDGTGLTRQCLAYNTNEDLWRIEEANGMLVFAVADSTVGTFRPIASVTVPFPLTALRPRFGTATDRAIGRVIGLSIDRFN